MSLNVVFKVALQEVDNALNQALDCEASACSMIIAVMPHKRP